jgi:hypothetical protein
MKIQLVTYVTFELVRKQYVKQSYQVSTWVTYFINIPTFITHYLCNSMSFIGKYIGNVNDYYACR